MGLHFNDLDADVKAALLDCIERIRTCIPTEIEAAGGQVVGTLLDIIVTGSIAKGEGDTDGPSDLDVMWIWDRMHPFVPPEGKSDRWVRNMIQQCTYQIIKLHGPLERFLNNSRTMTADKVYPHDPGPIGFSLMHESAPGVPKTINYPSDVAGWPE